MVLTFLIAMTIIAIIFGKLIFIDLSWLYIGIGITPVIVSITTVIMTKLSDIIVDIEIEEELQRKHQKSSITGYPTRRKKP
jgi:hypothetical protein